MATFDISIDDEGLAEALRAAAADLPRLVRPVVAKGALNVKTKLRSEASGSRHFRLASFITYDTKETSSGAEAEIGPEKRGAGNLGNIAYFGGAHGGGGTLPDPQLAANEEAPRFEKAIGDIVDGLL